MLVRRKLIREQALDVLARFGVKKAPVPIERLAEQLGARIVRGKAPDNLSGFVLREPNKGAVIIGVNSAHHENRQRFTIGHELGHFLLHKGQQLHVDRQWGGYQVKLRDEQSSRGTNIDEMEANLFAAELLMPIAFLDVDLAKLSTAQLSADEQINKLAEQYKVSEQALTLRLTYLGCIEQ
ncbi:MAG: ImmA/IrrE family metallo-endopeptidase [Acidimicrobiaceae bacterium]|nr:ImmA/IrrE family metallo-endopeptidase [Acidimicrobiaceae bacterium]